MSLQDRLMQHLRSPHGWGVPDPVGRRIEGLNALCGDLVEIYLTDDLGTGAMNLRFTAQGCAMCRASASVMVGALQGHSAPEALAMIGRFEAAFRHAPEADPWPQDQDLRALLDLRRYQSRWRCVLLPWETLRQGLGHSSPSGPGQ